MDNIKIKELYKKRYNFQDFYEIATTLINQNKLFSNGSNQSVQKEKIECQNGDIRVDLPISFGSEKATYRLAILGLEPRDSNSKYNINRSGKFVFGTPFGIEYWTEKNKYYRCFESLFQRQDCYLYFTDVVKEYEVKDSKGAADINARKTFWTKAALEDNITFLKSEFDIIKPTHILALGNDTHAFLKLHFGDKVVQVIHPNARQNQQSKLNAWEIA
ncbi:uracil-DNA glycosylase family protein, partial [Flavobacterium sp.]|uniref:uracil-DNA glycosylase family protein n=1 Tax=Flavobacterium sp. TaxID=239 RepID=UPI00333ED955